MEDEVSNPDYGTRYRGINENHYKTVSLFCYTQKAEDWVTAAQDNLPVEGGWLIEGWVIHTAYNTVEFNLRKIYTVPEAKAPTERRPGAMNYSTAVFVINKELRAVLAVYEGDYDNPKAKRTMFKTLDPDVKKDDLVVVPTGTRHGFTVVKVVETDVRVDLDDPTPVAWVVTRVDKTGFEALLKQEEQAINLIKDAEYRKRQKEIRDSIVANSAELTALPLYKNGTPKPADPNGAPKPADPTN